MDIAEVLKKAKPPEATVELCLEADLAAEHDELNRQLVEAQQEESRSVRKMGDVPKSRELAERITGLEERMRASQVVFRMRGISAYRYQELRDAHPGREGKNEAWNPVSFPTALIAACCVDPAMNEDEAHQLIEALGTGQTDKLFTAALQVTQGPGAVPFSLAASATLRANEQKQS